jgi:hypothetical protein
MNCNFLIKILRIILVLLLLSAIEEKVHGQMLLIDEGTQAGGLWCFPVYGDPNSFMYLSSRARLAVNEEHIPEFSFMRYVLEKPADESSAHTMTQASGGGLLHFLVLYDTPAEMVDAATSELRDKYDNNQIKLKGPVIFDKGRYALISSLLNSEGMVEKKLIASGEAPVLEGSRIALSFNVDPMRSKLLLESFKMNTPDISLVFEMGFSGLTHNYEALLEVDWDKIKNSQAFSAGGSVYYVSADIETGFDELIQNQAITLTTTGSNTNMEGLLNTVYNRLLELMFQPVEIAKTPENEKGPLEDAIASLLSNIGLLDSRTITGFGLGVSYQLKQLQSSGKARLAFSGRSVVSRNHYITFNIGNLYKKYGEDERIFKDVPLWDPSFQQMNVFVGIDGTLQREFGRMVNNVTVTLKKEHQNGSVTTRQLLVNDRIFKDSLNNLFMTYLNHQDNNLLEWMKYDYMTHWQFTGGGSLNTSWQRDSTSLINLYIPYRRQKIKLEGDLEMLSDKGVRAISVKITYLFFDKLKEERVTIRPKDDLSTAEFEITLPNHLEEVDYTITWIKTDQSRLETSGKDRFGLIFIDELPKE